MSTFGTIMNTGRQSEQNYKNAYLFSYIGSCFSIFLFIRINSMGVTT